MEFSNQLLKCFDWPKLEHCYIFIWKFSFDSFSSPHSLFWDGNDFWNHICFHRTKRLSFTQLLNLFTSWRSAPCTSTSPLKCEPDILLKCGLAISLSKTAEIWGHFPLSMLALKWCLVLPKKFHKNYSWRKVFFSVNRHQDFFLNLCVQLVLTMSLDTMQKPLLLFCFILKAARECSLFVPAQPFYFMSLVW